MVVLNSDWYQALVPAGALLALAVFARLQQRSWLAPGAFWLLFWSLCVWLPLLLAPHYSVWPPAIWHILAAATCVYFGSLIGLALHPNVLRHNATVAPMNPPPFLRMARLRVILLVCALLGLIGVLIMFQSAGYRLQVLARPEELAEMSGQLSIARYYQGYDMPLVSRILMSFAFAGCGLGGFFFLFRLKRQDIALACVSFLPLLIITLALTTRTTMLMAGIFWISGYLAGQIFRHGFSSPLFTPLRLATIVAGAAGFALLALTAQMLRAGQMSMEVLIESYDRTATIFFGHLGAFSIWLQTGTIDRYGFGAYTFGGIFDQLGLKSRELGIFGDSIEVADQQFTNVYTLFRCFIEDYSRAGSFVVLLLIGISAGYAYGRVSRGLHLSLWILMLFYIVTLWSHVTSILNYNSIILAVLLIAFCLSRTCGFGHRKNHSSDTLPKAVDATTSICSL